MNRKGTEIGFKTILLKVRAISAKIIYLKSTHSMVVFFNALQIILL